MMAVIVVLAVLTTLTAPRVYRLVTRYKVNQAARLVAADLEQAVTLAARARKPIRITLEGTNVYTLRDRATSPADTLRLRRSLSMTGDQGVETMTFSRSPVHVFPNGTTDGALTITTTGAGLTRTITLSPAGQVRLF